VSGRRSALSQSGATPTRTSPCPGGSGPAATWTQTSRCGTSPRRSEPQRHTERSGRIAGESERRAGGGRGATPRERPRPASRSRVARRWGLRTGPHHANASTGATAATAQCAVAQGLAGALDPARCLVVTESVVRAGGGIVWRRGEAGGVEIVLIHRPAYDDWSFPRASSTRARPRRRRRCARSRRRRACAAGWAVRSGPPPTVIPSDGPRPSATGR
jgi:hypothetical protein